MHVKASNVNTYHRCKQFKNSFVNIQEYVDSNLWNETVLWEFAEI